MNGSLTDTAELVIECDDTGVIRLVRGSISTHLGYDLTDVVDRPIGDFLHPRNQAVAGPIVSTLAGKPHLELWDEVRVRVADGTWRWMMASIKGGEPGRLPLHVAMRPIAPEDAAELDRRHDPRDLNAAEEHRFRLLAEAAPVGVFQESPVHGCTYVNPRWQEITGLTAAEAMGQGWLRAVHPDDLHIVAPPADGHRPSPPAASHATVRFIRPDGEVRWAKVGYAPVIGDDGELLSAVGTVDDITATIVADARVRRLTHVLEATPDLVGIYDAAEERLFLNEAARAFFGMPASDEGLTHSEFSELVPAWSADGWEATVGAHLFREGSWTGEISLVDVHGTTVPLSAVFVARRDATGAMVGVSGVLRDITQQKAMEATLEHQATHDPLTGLPNRLLLLDRLELALARAADTGRPVAVLFLDLDRFKVVNDSLGHALGDRVLVSLTERIREAVGPTQTVARFGGDEFVVLVEDLTDPSDSVRVANALAQVVRQPIDAAGEHFVVTSSIGIAVSGPDDTPETLLRDADAAMYRAKGAGRSRTVVFEPMMRADAVDRFDLEAALRRALTNDELRLHYQPKINLATGRIVGVEALVRWQHPTRGLLCPDDFLPVAEETGLITEVGAWVIHQALETFPRLDAARPTGTPPLYLCVNLSAEELAGDDLLPTIESALATTGVDADHIDIELTEHTLMADVEATSERLRALKALGLLIAVDDFGTGYSSLAYLRRFPVDMLKIDRTFVDGLGSRTEDSAIVRAVASLADSLGLQVVAEGVETAEQLAELRAIGCSMAQGYFIARPLPEEEIVALISSGRIW